MRGIRIAIAGLALTAAGSAVGQGLHESIGVDGKYVREVIVQDKIFTLPSRLNFKLDATPLSFSTQGIVTPFEPRATTMVAPTPFANRIGSDARGYLDLSLGSWLEGNLSAGYRFVSTPTTEVGAWLQFNSAGYYKPQQNKASDDIRRELADGRLGIFVSHKAGDAGHLDALAQYRLGWWNYYGYAALDRAAYLPDNFTIHAPTQTLNDVSARVGWISTRNRHGFGYEAALGVRYFGYRAFYAPSDESFNLTKYRGDRETNIFLSGSLSKLWSGGSQLGLDLRGDILLYAENTDAAPISLKDDYGNLRLKPYYRFSRGLLNVKAGAELDFTFNAREAGGKRYGTFHISPDITADWRKGAVGLYLNLSGGTELQTLASLHAADYYAMPAMAGTQPVYNPLDATLGMNFGPFAGFSAGLKLRYKVSRDVRSDGWYMAFLNYANLAMPGLTGTADYDPNDIYYGTTATTYNLNGMSLGLNLNYKLGEILSIDMEGTYQPQSGKTGFFNGYDRPRWTAQAMATVKPIKGLSISLEYEYRGVRNIYTQAANLLTSGSTTLPGTSIPVVSDSKPEPALCSLRLPDLTLLSAMASYQFTPKIGASVRAANLLNRHDATLPCAPLSGITVTAGVNFLF